ncbi:ATP-dependent RecD-like DNA helicase [bacterium]|nr:ATP-dependent RecD-like DNA helicase [bacterium]
MPNHTTESPAEQIQGTVARITFQNKENGFCVIKLRPETQVERSRLTGDNEIALVGVMPGVEVGEHLLAEGRWERDDRYGPRFHVAWFKPTLPTGERGIEVYLASGAIKGIGPKTAARIVAMFGEHTFEILDEEPNRLREVPGIGRKAVSRIIAGWKQGRGDRELIAFLGEHGLTPALAARLQKAYGQAALSIVRTNPYRLTTDVRGIGFYRADEIARRIGLPPDSVERIDAAIMHLLERQSEDGHTYVPREALEKMAAELVNVPVERVTGRIDDALETKRVTAADIAGQGAIFLNQLYDAERGVALRLRDLLSAQKRIPQIDAVGTLADFEQRTRFQLAPEQRRAALDLARQGMLILTGGPGTGKTTTVRACIELFARGRRQVRLAAPTGRAARRLAETSKMQAETIHRMLGYQPPLGKFSRNAANPIEADLVIIDEVSMLDVPLAFALLDAIAPGTCLLLVGDEDQLPSVGPGNVLGDLLAAGAMPIVRLTEIFRQAGESLIVTNAHRINRGLLPIFDPPRGGPEPDFYFIERETPDDIVSTIRTLIGERIPRKFRLDPRRDVQILTPMRRGELGVHALNDALKDLLNPGGEQILFEENKPAALAPGDRVMQTTNNYDKLIYNGDIGYVSAIDEETGEVLIDFDGRPVSFLADELDQITLAYATTIHKSQGSEFPAVIIPVHTQHWIMLQRNLIYTALTRAKRLACLVGTRKALRRAVANATKQERFTALKEMMDWEPRQRFDLKAGG